MKALVVIPTYNEAETILKVIGQVLAIEPRADVLVVDDGSPDGTAGLVAAQQTAESRLHLLRRDAKQGLGAAYRAGFAWGLARDYDALVEMDADLSHPPDRLPALLDALDHADLVIGSRYVAGGDTRNWSRLREAISRCGNLYVRLMLGLPVNDATAGFRAYRRAVLEGLRVANVRSSGYCFQIEMAHRAWQEGFAVAEVPITFTEREAGTSKMSNRIVAEALWRVAQWSVSGGRRRPRPPSGQRRRDRPGRRRLSMLRRREPDPVAEAAWAAFCRFAEALDQGSRALLSTVPSARHPGVPLETAVGGFLAGIETARAELQGWALPEVAAEHAKAVAALDAAEAAARDLPTAAGGLEFEHRNERLGDVLDELTDVEPAEQALRALRRRPRRSGRRARGRA